MSPSETAIAVRKAETVFDELETMHNQIMRRAYEIFAGRGSVFGNDLDDWFAAERELTWTPAAEVREKDNEFVVKVALAGFSPEELDIRITPEDLLIKAETRHVHKEGKGKVYLCEFTSGRVFRSIHFPRKIDSDKVKAEYRNGLLRITAPIAEEKEARKLEIKAA